MSKILYLGHATVMIINDFGNIVIDPFFTGNPLNPMKVEECNTKYILVTHGHSDHLGDTIQIAKNNDATVIAIYEVAHYLGKEGVKNLVLMNIGGTVYFDKFSVKMVQAIHTSSINANGNLIYGGVSVGYVIKLDDLTIYHAGDTALFSDMSIIGSQFSIDIAFLPVGGYFTMDANDALMAVKMIHPKYVVPMHYNTWDIISVDIERFKEMVDKETRSTCLILKPGEAF
ncbi:MULTISPECIES: metal-dependent hydrolase [Caldisericum]|jgi:L-ascorbate metabolism protein UlaG (beta-lactamase superfamily)|uniref:UPF0173 metal-dependent hydrolase C0175_00250 n=1 Tax=Caldisericum exile TaxID=693075 RepID=A0A2J6X9X8_9BACT|nr:MAG: metal-dependent hydrolase [Caldisericum exile]PMP84316.1 MAG: metal-dependent hydrolase [Caldisericum exile]